MSAFVAARVGAGPFRRSPIGGSGCCSGLCWSGSHSGRTIATTTGKKSVRTGVLCMQLEAGVVNEMVSWSSWVPWATTLAGGSAALVVSLRAWLLNRMRLALTAPTGPYVPGSIDVKCKDSDLVFRLFYPSSLSPAEVPPLDALDKWIPGVDESEFNMYVRGLLQSLGMDRRLYRILLSFIAQARIRAAPNAPAAMDAGKLPLVIFSHGLHGLRSTYSVHCTELASHGFCVAAIEHNDGSASFSVRPTGQVTEFQPVPVDARGTEREFEFRNAQLRTRVGEVVSLLDALDRGTSLHVTSQMEKVGLAGRLDTTQLHLSGHSFGAATALELAWDLVKQGRQVQSCVALDSWLFPVSEHVFKSRVDEHVSLAFVNNSQFQWETNLQRMASFEKRVQVTLVGASHQTQSDLLILVPELLLRLIGMTADGMNAHESLAISNELALRFLLGGKLAAESFRPSDLVAWDQL
ncbi:Platelet-activating factor acetylhydrolase 2, cytoplasmic [Porphyridium purpureum]|uniref:1-alkyl-2-acetylglycerophosphocholine esterase n=1 Tax=Porphyridium purpureum TaxID=35688 RepID=A0A5J4Z950_PORPP|nr:Platelet-activating factor acetylhydrolase 2, cytoplasmic [Porphyridium purpureum]|eukprot:POR2236..scf295_1